jgi:phosphoenolpyruvate carboxylase
LQELFAPLHLMYESLLSTSDESTANHRLLDLLRQVCKWWVVSSSETEVAWMGRESRM